MKLKIAIDSKASNYMGLHIKTADPGGRVV
jgi:hypothetical protein